MLNHGHYSLSDWHDALIKEAFIGAMAAGIGKFVAKNPLKTLGAAMTVNDVATAGAKGARTAAESAARNAGAATLHAGPTF